MHKESMLVKINIIGMFASTNLSKSLLHLQYCDKYGDNVGFPRIEEWRKQLCLSALINSDANLETYRDSWDDHELLQEALQSPHFTQLGLEDSPM